MDYAACYVVYVDRTAYEDRLFTNDEALPLETRVESLSLNGEMPENTPNQQLHDNIATLLQTFGGGMRS